jgi:hypothetical protein
MSDQVTTTPRERDININHISYEKSKQFQWKAIEPMRIKNGKWSQRCQCAKTGKFGVRRGFFL